MLKNELAKLIAISFIWFLVGAIISSGELRKSDLIQLAFNEFNPMEGGISDLSCKSNPSTCYGSVKEQKEKLILLTGEIRGAELISKLLSNSERIIINRTTGVALLSTYERNEELIEGLAIKSGLKIEELGEGGEGYFTAEKNRLFPYMKIKGKNQGILTKEPIQALVPRGLMVPVEIDDTCTGFPEGFEGAVWYPSGNWYHYQDNLGHNNGSYFWNDKTCAAHTGSWSGDAILGGSTGGGLSCGANYPNDLTCDSNASWMQYVYWITCTYGASAANLDFWYQLNSESGYDYFKVLTSVDGTNAYGYAYSGLNGSTWLEQNLNLKSWSGIGDLTTYSGGFILWFEFCSDSSVNYSFGARLDDITITYTALDCSTGFAENQITSENKEKEELTPQELAWKERELKGSVVLIRNLPNDDNLYASLINYANRVVLDRNGKKFLGDFLLERLTQLKEITNKYRLYYEILGQGGEESFNQQKELYFPELNEKKKELSGYAFKDEIKIVAPADAPKAIPQQDENNSLLTTCISEGFEGIVWAENGGNWYHWQGNNPNNTGKFYWIDDTCDKYSGLWQADAIRGGQCGSQTTCGATYPPNLTCAYPGIGNMAWMKYRYWITCANGAATANLITYFKLKSESNYDFLRWLFSTDDTNFYGYQLSGDYSTSWYYTNNDMKTWPTLGDLTTYPQVALAFTFCSDSSVQSGFGAYMDDISIEYTTCTAPGTPSGPNPADGSTVCGTPTLSWTAASGATSYDVYVDGSIKCADITTTSCNPGSLTDGSHSWYVVAKNSCGSTTGPTWSFTQNPLPGQASNPNPADGSTVCSSPTLSWTAAAYATSYDVYVDGSLKCSNITTTSCNPGSLTNGSHSWYVVSKNSCGSTTGLSWGFTISSSPTLPSNPNPADGSTVCSTPTLTWSPSSFEYLLNENNGGIK